MLNIAAKNIFVKGFVTDNLFEFVNPEECVEPLKVVVTDLTITAIIEIASATKNGNGWNIICHDGNSYVVEQEPENIRNIACAIVVKNYKDSFLGASYDVVLEDEYDKVNKANEKCRLIGRVNGDKVVTGPLVKFWSDGVRYHGITKSGTHYVWG